MMVPHILAYTRLLKARRNFFGRLGIEFQDGWRPRWIVKPGHRQQLASMRDRHEGRRCFVIANGASLDAIDGSKLRDEVTIGCYGVHRKFREWGFQADYLVFDGRTEADRPPWDTANLDRPIKLVPLDAAQGLAADEHTLFFMTPANPKAGYYRSRLYPQFSRDFATVVHPGAGPLYFMLQWAYHLGCDPVYVIGVDPIASGQEHDLEASRQEAAFRLAKEEFQRVGRCLLSASPQTHWAGWEQVEYDGIFSQTDPFLSGTARPSEEVLLELANPGIIAEWPAQCSIHHLKPVSEDLRATGTELLLVRSDPDKNGVWSFPLQIPALPHTALLCAEADVLAEEADAVGINLYVYDDPEDPAKRRVYQSNHPGGGQWTCLNAETPLSASHPPHRTELLFVVRPGAPSATLRRISVKLLYGLRALRLPDHDYYHLSPEYYRYCQDWVFASFASKGPELVEKLLRYYLGANRAGAHTLQEVESRLGGFGVEIQGSRFLDIGCGTAGTLAAALERGAAYCEGWELSDEKLRLGRMNLETLSGENVPVQLTSFSMEDTEKLDKAFVPFDLVLCEQVLEHVKRLEESVATLARAIHPAKGAGYITVPNGFSAENVLADPHLMLFGITLLDRFEAAPAARGVQRHTSYADMMGEYHTHAEYVDIFGRHGLDTTPLCLPEYTREQVEHIVRKLHAIEVKAIEIQTAWGARVGFDTLWLLGQRVTDYLTEARRRLEKVQAPGAPLELQNDFVRDYGTNVFAFLLRHKAAS